jgi:dipeptidyl aminopeptidase/acylaminoacyl peptidase
MAMGIRELLNLPVWRAFDVDDAGRILAGSDASGSMQLVELAPDGTATALTALPGACVGRYLQGTDTRAVVVEHDQGGDERKQLSLLPLDPPPAAPVGLDGLTPLVRDPRYFHNLIAALPGRVVYTTNRRNDVDFDIVVREVATGAETVLYRDGGGIEDVAVSPDGRRAAIVRFGNLAMSEQLLFADADGRIRPLSPDGDPSINRRPRWIGGDGADPDTGSAAAELIATSNRDREFNAVYRLDPATGASTELVADPEHDLTGWPSPDGALLLVQTNDDGAARFSLHQAATGRELAKVALPGLGWAGEFPLPEPLWSPDSRQIVLSFSGPTVPGDILRLEIEPGTETVGASVTVSTVASSTGTLQEQGIRLAEPVSHRVPTADGEYVPCFVFQSPDAAAAREAAADGLAGAAVLHVHGGPEAQAVLAFHPQIQGLVAAGLTVLVPNVRGSTGYGKRWYAADDVRKRLDSVADLAALHAWLPSQGLDQARAALWGGSYGGYMVLAGLGFQPQLWAAGVDIVGMSSLVTFLENTSAYRRTLREREYGSLEHDREFLESASPLSRVDDIRAPLFVIHGANDPRVPLGEAEQLKAALDANGVPCELLVYHDEGHGLAKRANRLDAFPRAIDFVIEHLSR